MRTSLIVLLALTTLGSTACSGLADGDEAAAQQSSALGDPRIPLDPVANPTPCCTLDPTPRTPGEVVPPTPPASLYGTITSYAGFPGHYGHDNGPVQTSFTGPSFVASTPTGLTWVVDIDGDPSQSCIRLIQDTRGAAAGGKHVQTILKHGDYNVDVNAIGGVAVDPVSGDLFMSDSSYQVSRLTVTGSYNQISGFSSYGASWSTPPPAGYADLNNFGTRFDGASGLARNAQGHLFVADTKNHAIRRLVTTVDPSGYPLTTATTVVRDMSGTFSPTSLAIDPRDGSFYATSGQAVYHAIPGAAVSNPSGAVGQVVLHAGAPTTAGFQNTSSGKLGFAFALFNTPKGIAVDRSGNVYVADMGNKLIRKIVAGTPVAVETVSFYAPNHQPSFDGYGPDDDVTLEAPFGLSFWGDALVMTDGLRGNVRVLH